MLSFEMGVCDKSRDSVDEFIDFNCILLRRIVYLDSKKKRNDLKNKRQANIFKGFDVEETPPKKTLGKKISYLISQMKLR